LEIILTGKFFNIFWPIVVVIIGSYSAYFFSQDKVELQYYLTESIPVLINNGEVLESVQQLTVINSGEVTIESIGIKIKGKIKEVNLIKNFVDDKVSQSISDTYLQAKYFKLPPNSNFVYIIKSSVGGVTSSHIDISYSKGKAVNALEPSESSNAWAIVYILFISIYLIYMFFSMLKGREVNTIEFSSYENILTILNETKPFYVNQNDWDSARKKYIESKRDIKYFHATNLQEDESYKILNSEKPHNSTDFEWDNVIETMSEHFTDLYKYNIKTCSREEQIFDLLSIDKPKNISELVWKELNKEVGEELFYISNVNKHSFSLFLKPSTEFIADAVPKNIDKNIWADYVNALKDKYFVYILFNVSDRFSSRIFNIEEYDLDILGKRQKQDIEHLIYNLKFNKLLNITSEYNAKSFLESLDYAWLNENDRSNLEEIANSHIKLKDDIEEHRLLRSNLESIINGVHLGDNHEKIDIDMWKELKEIECKIIDLSEKNSKEKSLIEKDKIEICEIKSRVVKQLSIISNVLNNPKTVNEIEDYDNPFAEGNFNNLKKVAELLEEI
jgi:hypothetical protein